MMDKLDEDTKNKIWPTPDEYIENKLKDLVW
jgi:hypothetical protein